MVVSIFVLSIVLIAFVAVFVYLLKLKKEHRSLDEDDCIAGKRKILLLQIKAMKKKERKEALKKKRELEKLDRKSSGKNN